MTTLDPASAIDYALSQSRWRASGLCLEFVDHCFGQPGSRLGDNGGPRNGSWQEAKDGYYFSRYQHLGDMNPPPGVPVYWETGPSRNEAGHIVLSLGGGWCRTTDYAGAASVSTQTIESITRARRWSRHPDGGYLGWTEDYGGNPIAGITGTTHPDATPFKEDDSMSAADVEQLKAYIDQRLIPGGFLLQCSAPGCGIALVAPGYFNGLSGEQVEQLIPIYGMPLDCGDNKRAWDVRVSSHLQGQVPGAIPRELAESALAAISKLAGN
ncbi:hypothetical protein ACFJGV_15190 [Cnuibacter sp. UC19_7]|uniref:hypothetical protein n=1 Tax=Cnuibacter sp. UC19_7 TaxID=3350166 RepID=UPI00366A631A